MNRPPPLAHRLFAALCTALVLALGVVGASDRLHAQLHAAPSDCGHDHGPAGASYPSRPETHDATCAVDLYAAGISLPVDPTHVVVAPLTADEAVHRGAPDFRVVGAPHRQPPGRGPPSL